MVMVEFETRQLQECGHLSRLVVVNRPLRRYPQLETGEMAML